MVSYIAALHTKCFKYLPFQFENPRSKKRGLLPPWLQPESRSLALEYQRKISTLGRLLYPQHPATTKGISHELPLPSPSAPPFYATSGRRLIRFHLIPPFETVSFWAWHIFKLSCRYRQDLLSTEPIFNFILDL